MPDHITVRKALESDTEVLVQFNKAMALETEQKHLSERLLVPGVKRLCNKPEYGHYLVAETGGRIAGALMVTKEWSDWRNGLFWWIQSVYVLPEFRRQGVYRIMYHYLRDQAENDPDVCGLRLYVERENESAQKTYTRLGMNATRYLMFEEELQKKSSDG